MNDSSKLIRSIIRNDLSSFIHKVFNTVNPGAEYVRNWHIDLIAEYLKEVESGNIKRLIINIPPRSLKSLSISVAWPAWLLGHNPRNRIMVASYSQILSNKLSLDSRFIVSSDWYKKLFQDTKIHSKQNTKSKFLTTKYGFRFATSVGGSITGEGGDYLIVDDPHNPSQMSSEKIRKKTIDWFSETFSTRLNNRADGKIILVMQRLHEDDLTGHLLNNKKDEWELLKIPVQTDKKIYFHFKNFKYEMEKGETLSNKLFSDDVIENLIKEIGQSNFSAQYLQSPNIHSCGILKFEYLMFYTNPPESYDLIVQSWDTAIKISENSDYSACTTWGVKGDCYYLINAIEHKYEYPQLKKQVNTMDNLYKPNVILIEDKSSGHSLIQDLRNEGLRKIIPIKPTNDKITRFATCLDLFENSKVYLPTNGFIFQKVINQITRFPNCKNDDLVDSITQFLNYIKHRKNLKPQIRNL